MSSVREETERLSPRKVPKRPSVTKSETALFKNLSQNSSPPRREETPSEMMAGVLVSLPQIL